ncbi:MAG: class I SAM-dependent methyltransferase [Planctomycetes bacterium]|nr:class I SAM-dependent methyltransferase [Planctomycetota bacterium]
MTEAAAQARQDEWHYQWANYRDKTEFLFREWIAPNTLESMKGESVLEAGCGGGHHTRLIAQYAARVTAVDLNTDDLAREALAEFKNVEIRNADIATMNFDELFDTVICVGVVQHTDDPDATVANLRRCVKPGGRVIIWCYSHEGNALARWLIEFPRKLFLRFLPRPLIALLSWWITLWVYPLAYTWYLLPLKFLPYYEYIGNWRRLSARRNMLNVFDKLNAPQTQFIRRARAEAWARDPDFTLEHLSAYVGVSWRVTLRRKKA